jgi:hypothetical protein
MGGCYSYPSANYPSKRENEEYIESPQMDENIVRSGVPVNLMTENNHVIHNEFQDHTIQGTNGYTLKETNILPGSNEYTTWGTNEYRLPGNDEYPAYTLPSTTHSIANPSEPASNYFLNPYADQKYAVPSNIRNQPIEKQIYNQSHNPGSYVIDTLPEKQILNPKTANILRGSNEYTTAGTNDCNLPGNDEYVAHTLPTTTYSIAHPGEPATKYHSDPNADQKYVVPINVTNQPIEKPIYYQSNNPYSYAINAQPEKQILNSKTDAMQKTENGTQKAIIQKVNAQTEQTILKNNCSSTAAPAVVVDVSLDFGRGYPKQSYPIQAPTPAVHPPAAANPTIPNAASTLQQPAFVSSVQATVLHPIQPSFNGSVNFDGYKKVYDSVYKGNVYVTSRGEEIQ